MNHSARIKFYCRSFNKELYLISRRLYEDAGYPCVRLTDQTAEGYFFTMLEDEECDIAINVDEDCFITDLDAVLALAHRVVQEGWVNAGCSDAGVGVPRRGDQLVTNPFFNVFNLREIRREWNASKLIPQLRKDSYKGIEPYYNFFYWMVQTFPNRTLYLDNSHHPDGITTQLADASGRILCQHSWFARLFRISWLTRLFEGNDRKDINQSLRINAVIDEVYLLRHMQRPEFGFVQRVGFFFDECIRWSVKIPQRIAGWPKKIKRRMGR
ncbi:MAG: hypothetical protein Q4B58_02865 [Bacteroidales bacterium]|nr:hypothetical protein [Bacteroidales bacterium]